MGPVKLIKDLPDDFLVMNGDVLSDLDYGKFLDDHTLNGNLFTISASTRNDKVDYGVLRIDDQGVLTAFEEKPIHQYLVSMGVYALNKAVLDYIPRDIPFGFDELMHTLLEKEQKVAVLPYSGYWLDIGRPDDYAQAIEDCEKGFLGGTLRNG
jgi:NDP-sugar pyrophosphorylase family protein